MVIWLRIELFGFSFNNLTLNKKEFSVNDTIKLYFNLYNKSAFDGKEVVQLYIHDDVSSVVTPVKQLKLFKKITIPANQSVQVIMELPVKDLWLINAEGKKVTEAGLFNILIGNSSDDIKLKEQIIVRQK